MGYRMKLSTLVKARGFPTVLQAARAIGVSIRTLAKWNADPVKREEILEPALKLAHLRLYGV
jgi:hypothetical protein